MQYYKEHFRKSVSKDLLFYIENKETEFLLRSRIVKNAVIVKIEPVKYKLLILYFNIKVALMKIWHFNLLRAK